MSVDMDADTGVKNTGVSPQIADLLRIHDAGAANKYRHDGEVCYSEAELNGVPTRHWMRVKTLDAFVEDVCRTPRPDLVKTLRRCASTPENRMDYAADFPKFPLIQLSRAWSTSTGVYFYVTGRFVPYRVPRHTRVAQNVLVAWALGAENENMDRNSRLPVDVLRTVASFAFPTWANGDTLMTQNIYPLPWEPREMTLVQNPPTIDVVPVFLRNLAAHGYGSGNKYPFICVQIGYAMYRDSPVFLVSDQSVALHASPLYALLCTLLLGCTHSHRQLPIYNSVSNLPFYHPVNDDGDDSDDPFDRHPDDTPIVFVFNGMPSEARETRVMEVVRLCAHYYLHYRQLYTSR
jgi:hypothetical protein